MRTIMLMNAKGGCGKTTLATNIATWFADEGKKVALVDLDALSVEAQNVLLKVLEEPPSYALLICSGSGTILSTVRSRCRVIRFSPLSDDEVAEVLRGLGRSEWMAEQMARMAGGSVAAALEMEKAVEARGRVLTFVDAVARRDRGALWGTMARWDGNHSRLLRQWCAEVVAGRPRSFTASELEPAARIGARQVRGLVRGMMDGLEPAAAALTGAWG